MVGGREVIFAIPRVTLIFAIKCYSRQLTDGNGDETHYTSWLP